MRFAVGGGAILNLRRQLEAWSFRLLASQTAAMPLRHFALATRQWHTGLVAHGASGTRPSLLTAEPTIDQRHDDAHRAAERRSPGDVDDGHPDRPLLQRGQVREVVKSVENEAEEGSVEES